MRSVSNSCYYVLFAMHNWNLMRDSRRLYVIYRVRSIIAFYANFSVYYCIMVVGIVVDDWVLVSLGVYRVVIENVTETRKVNSPRLTFRESQTTFRCNKQSSLHTIFSRPGIWSVLVFRTMEKSRGSSRNSSSWLRVSKNEQMVNYRLSFYNE